MSQINFLPASFRRQYARQKRRPIEFAVIAGTILGLIGLWFSLGGPDQALANELEQIEREIVRVNQMHDERDELNAQRSSLQRRLLIARETYQPITTTQALARLSELAPESIRFIVLEINNKRPEPEPPATPTRPGLMRNIGNNQKTPAREPSQMRVSITGHAPSDREVVVFIRRLREDPVFSTVAPLRNRPEKTDTHAVREFRLEVTIDMDRRFVPATPPDKEGPQ